MRIERIGKTWEVGFTILALLAFSVHGTAVGQEKPSKKDVGKASSPPEPTLDEMISTALKSHPEIAAAQAELQVAQANLDRVRLEIAQRVVGYSKMRQSLESKMEIERARFEEIMELHKRAPGTISEATLRSKEAEVVAVQIELAAVKSQLQFVLGNTGRQPTSAITSDETRKYAEEMVAHAKTEYEVLSALYKGGKGTFGSVELSARKLLEAEDRLHGPTMAAAEAYRDRTTAHAEAIRQMYEGGVSSLAEYASAQHRLAEANWFVARRK